MSDDVPDLEGADGFRAEWYPDEGIVYAHQLSLQEAITITPTEIRQLYAWVEQHNLQ